jgi:3',5'-cyclic AMP phosphodiesterase CpdA
MTRGGSLTKTAIAALRWIAGLLYVLAKVLALTLLVLAVAAGTFYVAGTSGAATLDIAKQYLPSAVAWLLAILSFVAALIVGFTLIAILAYISAGKDEPSKSGGGAPTTGSEWSDSKTAYQIALDSLILQSANNSEPLRNLTAYFETENRPQEWIPIWLYGHVSLLVALLPLSLLFAILSGIASSIWHPLEYMLDGALIFYLQMCFFKSTEKIRSRLYAFAFGPLLSPQTTAARSKSDLALIIVSIAAGVASYCVWLDGKENPSPGVFVEVWKVVAIVAVAICCCLVRIAVTEKRRWGASKADFVLLRDLNAPPDAAASTRIGHLTDLHITCPVDRKAQSPAEMEERRTVSREAGGNWRRLRNLLVSNAHRIDDLSAVLVTGDITDTAAAAEWRGFFDAIAAVPRLVEKLVIVPGNHDVNLCHPWKSDNSDLIRRKLNFIRFLTAVDTIQGDRTWIVSDQGELVSFSESMADFTHAFRLFAKTPPARSYDTTAYPMATTSGIPFINFREVTTPATEALIDLPELVWINSFPMVTRFKTGGPWYLLLDSNQSASNIFTNAFGEIGADQLTRVRRFLDAHPNEPVILAVHHHVGNPERMISGLIDRLMDRALTLTNAVEFVDSLPPDRRFPLFNGHRHLAYMGSIGDKLIAVAGPSSTMGDALQAPAARLPELKAYHIYWNEGGNVCGMEELRS